MDMEIKNVGNGKIAVYMPYSKEFVDFAHKNGGKWDSDEQAWIFDERDREKVTKKCVKLFNYIEPGDQAVTIRFPGTLLYNPDERGDDGVYLLGTKIAYRRERDDRVRMIDGCRLLEGEFKRSAGSTKYPKVGDVEELVFELRTFPKSRLPELDKLVNSYEDDPDYWYKLIDDSDHVDREALEAELEKILARAAEIEELLKAS